MLIFIMTCCLHMFTVVDCGPPGEPSNGDVNIPRTTFAAIVSYECDDGYELEGKSTRSCQANGQWEGSVPSCKPIDCGKPSEPRNGEAVYAQTVFKSSIRYICNQGYELSGNEVSVCQASGSYSGSVPTCTPVDCGSLSLTNGDVQLSSGTTLGSTASYTCNVGYELSGSDRRTCRADGAWSGSTPSCSRELLFVMWLVSIYVHPIVCNVVSKYIRTSHCL